MQVRISHNACFLAITRAVRNKTYCQTHMATLPRVCHTAIAPICYAGHMDDEHIHILPPDHGQDFNAEALKHKLEEYNDFQTMADVFRLLGDPNRLRILWLLCHCEECVIDIAALVDMSAPAVSHHLKVLKAGGLITSRRSGKEVYYTAANTDTMAFLHTAIEQVMDITCPEE